MHRILCPNCGHRLKYGDEHHGKKALCQKCGHSFRLPDPGSVDPSENAHGPEASSSDELDEMHEDLETIRGDMKSVAQEYLEQSAEATRYQRRPHFKSPIPFLKDTELIIS